MKYDSQEIVHIKDGNLEYIQFKVLNDLNVKHCITLRHGGLSLGEYSTLNFRTLGQDTLENVLGNLEIVRNSVGFSEVHKACQAHTDKMLVINKENEKDYEFSKLNKEEYDGYVVDKPGIATLITTADCNPIIIYDKAKNVVANVHAGWKGVINRIYINAIKLMQEKYESKVEDLVICIGPSIRKCCFTSQEDSFKEKFTSVFEYAEDYLEYEEDNVTFHIDLIKILKHEFENVGVDESQIHVAPICTRCSTDDFFSYRYAVQNKFKDYGTMATIVELSENNV
ncbi:MAG: peptidoglycan editing factor PgeF [Clostridia bacterium]|nr:peptidoglycan editing factor PgeF [Clostridia bacterium]